MGNIQFRIAPSKGEEDSRGGSQRVPFSLSPEGVRQTSPLDEEIFHAMLTLERRRAERSRQPFVLMLLDAKEQNGSAARLLYRAQLVIASSTRETDLIGWYQQGSILAIIFTELTENATDSVAKILGAKILEALREGMGPDQAKKVSISVHFFPENWDREQTGWVADTKLYSNLRRGSAGKQASLAVKRAIDIAGSAMLLLLMSPVLAVVAAAIKLTSKGPVLFRQDRMGQYGQRFKFLKFRSMHTNSDAKIHKDFVHEFISGKESAKEDSSKPSVYKITNDPRVTSVGRFLRKMSLDELPQFWNVLRGEMSLVGPRPPVPYEFEVYDIWHRRRVLEVKPGITGLWQVSGRSRTRFDDMVRLDLRYCRSWSVWLDLKILAATPRAVFSGDGAY